MTSVLDHAETRQTVYSVSVEFYHEAARLGLIDKDVELLEGVLFTKMAKSPLHQSLARKLQRLLEKALGRGFFVDRECPITCARSEPEPDLAVFAGSVEDYMLQHPSTAELVIEIAINTVQRDRSKAAIYAGAAVKEYWLVEPESGTITVHSSPSVQGYASQKAFTAHESAASSVIQGFEVKLADLMA
jgi:Uma2 family endonuclease